MNANMPDSPVPALHDAVVQWVVENGVAEVREHNKDPHTRKQKKRAIKAVGRVHEMKLAVGKYAADEAIGEAHGDAMRDLLASLDQCMSEVPERGEKIFMCVAVTLSMLVVESVERDMPLYAATTFQQEGTTVTRSKNDG